MEKMIAVSGMRAVNTMELMEEIVRLGAELTKTQQKLIERNSELIAARDRLLEAKARER